ncbi:MAG TPA: bifunctional hydroxymethylpyrimidine kinase/phosphomethylpyrimidine kinase [Opitutaceae bacterium]|nr:bifunctional hydroxymethylpyrimidine kinase/phosphomethylpyrimidine kinase [Opitutaceae bacterium]
MSSKLPPCVLTIAGSDSGGGAGVQADARTIHALGGFACMAITAITAQNTRGVKSWSPQPPDVIAAQIAAVLGGKPARKTRSRRSSGVAAVDGALPIRAIKTGLLPGADAVRAVAQAVAGASDIPLVVDPVIGSTSGTTFLDAGGIRALRDELLPHAALVTPNWPEAEALMDQQVHTFVDAEQVAVALARRCGCAVLVKGGHAPGDECHDCLVTRDGQVHWFESPRIQTANTHGTGCVLSSAIATNLALGHSLESSVERARKFLQDGLRSGRRLHWGGAGPAFVG